MVTPTRCIDGAKANSYSSVLTISIAHFLVSRHCEVDIKLYYEESAFQAICDVIQYSKLNNEAAV